PDPRLRPPRPTLFPSTTLFRSPARGAAAGQAVHRGGTRANHRRGSGVRAGPVAGPFRDLPRPLLRHPELASGAILRRDELEVKRGLAQEVVRDPRFPDCEIRAEG